MINLGVQAKFICYEDMKRDLMAEMESLEQFVGVPLSMEQRVKVVKHCSFDSMKVSQGSLQQNH